LRVRVKKCDEDCTVSRLGEEGLVRYPADDYSSTYVVFKDGYGFYFAEEHLEVLNEGNV
jgi:hypothetical protein